MTANSSISRELHILKFLERQCRKGLSANYIVQLLDAFIHIGPNGTHQCLVFELLGLQLVRFSRTTIRLTINSTRKLCSEFLRSFQKLSNSFTVPVYAIEVRELSIVGLFTHILLDISSQNIAFSCIHKLSR